MAKGMVGFKLGAKVCSKCGETKNTSDFGTHPTTSDGLRSDCKACVSKRYQSTYRNTTPEAIAKLDRVQKFVRGFAPLTDLDDDEVTGSFIRDSNGVPVHSKDLDKKFQTKFTTELTRRLNAYLRSKAPRVVEVLFEIADSDLVEPADRIKAATWLAERVIGKTPETLLITKTEAPYEAVFEQMEGGSREDYRNSLNGHAIIDAEVVGELEAAPSSGDSQLEDNNENNEIKLGDIQDKINEAKSLKERVRKARNRRYALRALGFGLDEPVPWLVELEPVEDVETLVELVADGYTGTCAWRVTLSNGSDAMLGATQ